MKSFPTKPDTVNYTLLIITIEIVLHKWPIVRYCSFENLKSESIEVILNSNDFASNSYGPYDMATFHFTGSGIFRK